LSFQGSFVAAFQPLTKNIIPRLPPTCQGRKGDFWRKRGEKDVFEPRKFSKKFQFFRKLAHP
jgi:hypothetical protein